VAAAALLAACSGGPTTTVLELQATEEPAAERDRGTGPGGDPSPKEEEPEPEDPYAVPDEIDEDYVERVINAILEVQSEVLRGALQQEQGENLDSDLLALPLCDDPGSRAQRGHYLLPADHR
jgi:hypothetical protein